MFKLNTINEKIINDLININVINQKNLDKIFLEKYKNFPLEITKIIYNYIKCEECIECCSLCILHCSLNDICFRKNINVCCKYEINTLNKNFERLKIHNDLEIENYEEVNEEVIKEKEE